LFDVCWKIFNLPQQGKDPLQVGWLKESAIQLAAIRVLKQYLNKQND